MKHSFQIELKLDGKLIKASKVFTTTKRFISEAYELADALEDKAGSECEVVLFIDDEYEDSAFFDKQDNYSKNFCSIISQLYYVCDLFVYID